MSAQVTVQRTFTTTTTSALLVNVGYIKSLPGLLKLFQTIIGCVIIGIIGYYLQWNTYGDYYKSELFFLIVASACLITTCLLLVACLFSIVTASIMPKTLFELMYHAVAMVLYLAAGIMMMIHLNHRNGSHVYYYGPKTTAAVSMHYGVGSYLLLYSSINLLSNLAKRNQLYFIYERGYNAKTFASVLGLVNGFLYLLSTIYSVQTYRRS